MQPSLLLAVAGAGGLGAVARHLLATCIKAWWPDLPLAVAVVNVAGCLGFGVCWALAAGRWSPAVHAAVFAGFFGGFTTFSSFAHECHELLVAGRTGMFLLDAIGQNLLGIAAMAAGIALGAALRPA